MAFANNKGDARTLYQSLFSPTGLQAQHYTQFWSKVNCEVAQWCEINLGDRFVWSRFEDLCLQPQAELQRIVDKLGITLKKETLSQCSEMVVTPCSIGRWRSASKELQEKLLKSGKEGLYQFKYQPRVHG
jgi:predicted RecB family nuclease